MADVRQQGPIVEATAGASLGGHRVVAIIGGVAVYADKDTPSHRGAVRGITTQAVSNGGTTRVQVLGPMVEPSFAFAAGPVYVGSNGSLTQTVPTTGFLQQVAYAETATNIFVDPQPPVKLA